MTIKTHWIRHYSQQFWIWWGVLKIRSTWEWSWYQEQVGFLLYEMIYLFFFLDCSSYNVMVTLKEITDNISAVLTEMLNSSDITSSTTVTNFVTSLQSFITELSNYYAQQISSISGACSTSSAAPTSTAQPSTSTAGSTSTAQTSTSTTGSTSTAQPSTSTAGSSSTAQPSTLTAGSTSTAVLIK